ncbi:MAG TPA: hypothetical protein EYP05_09580 [Piscirickettsiaceae bacterium]|nr:hypothetical protein [Piscirickettsiaceae bacterium]HIQ40013.1 hypothetical protein [Sulfurivirga caldicuralii]
MGWDCEQFYPHDLPEDWRLEYYANYFSALLVPSSQWPEWDEADWTDFLDRSDTLRWIGFGFKAAPDDSQAARLHEVLTEIAARGQAVGLFSHEPLPDELLQWPVTWFDRADGRGQWRWRQLSGAPAGWLDALPAEARAQRQILEAFAASLPQDRNGAPFIVKQGCANMQALTQFKRLTELLGL